MNYKYQGTLGSPKWERRKSRTHRVRRVVRPDGADNPDFENKKVRAILAAARRLFVDEHLASPSMDLIAATAGVSKATIYVYFPDRERLLVALIEREIESTVPGVLWESEIEVTDIEAELRGIARRLMTVFLTFLGNDRTFHRLVEDLSLHSPGLGLKFYAAGPGRIRQQIVSFLKMANARRLLAVPNVELAAMQLTSLVHGDLRIRKTLAMPLPSRQECNAIVDGSVRVFLAAYGRRRR
jgi:TetR/AcrR family transcriptional regulator, mexJK operon transcriptional repressor